MPPSTTPQEYQVIGTQLQQIEAWCHGYGRVGHGIIPGVHEKDNLVDDYVKLFQARIDMIDTHVGNPGHHLGLHKEVFNRDNPTITDKTLA